MNTKLEAKQLEPGRELDALVAEKVMGWKFTKPSHGTCCTCQRCGRDQDTCMAHNCEFSGDIEAAWQVVEKLAVEKNARLKLFRYSDGWYGSFRMGPHKIDDACFDVTQIETAPHAICLAALKAVGGI